MVVARSGNITSKPFMGPDPFIQPPSKHSNYLLQEQQPPFISGTSTSQRRRTEDSKSSAHARGQLQAVRHTSSSQHNTNIVNSNFLTIFKNFLPPDQIFFFHIKEAPSRRKLFYFSFIRYTDTALCCRDSWRGHDQKGPFIQCDCR